MIDYSHLDALIQRSANERQRLNASKTDAERIQRQVWVDGIEKEISAEYKFLCIPQPAEMSLEEVFAEMDKLGF